MVLIDSGRICVQCDWWRPSLCTLVVFFLVSGAALESGMQHFVLKQKIMLHLVDFTVFFLSKSSWLVVWVGWCMAGGEQCASTSELWSVWEVMSQCVGFGHFWVSSLCALFLVWVSWPLSGWQCNRLSLVKMSRLCV